MPDELPVDAEARVTSADLAEMAGATVTDIQERTQEPHAAEQDPASLLTVPPLPEPLVEPCPYLMQMGPAPERIRRPTAIVGTTSHREFAPYRDPRWEVWAVGAHQGLPRLHTFWDLHNLELYGPKFADYMKGLEAVEIPVIVGYPTKRVKYPMLFPWDAMIRNYGKQFFTSSVACMLALAIEKRVPEIYLAGVDMATQEEYRKQKDGCLHFIWLARSHGIPVTIAPGSDLHYERDPYPKIIETPFEQRCRRQKDDLDVQLSQVQMEILNLDDQRRALLARQYRIEGALEAVKNFQTNWTTELSEEKSLCLQK